MTTLYTLKYYFNWIFLDGSTVILLECKYPSMNSQYFNVFQVKKLSSCPMFCISHEYNYSGILFITKLRLL